MNEPAALAAIVSALTIGVVSPGPSFVMVARIAVASSRTKALGTAVGMGAGGALFGAAALLGLRSVFHAVPALYVGLKVLGGLYLAWLGLSIFRAARRPLGVDEPAREGAPTQGFRLGLVTHLSNPKTAIVYAGVFAAFLPPHFSTAFAAVLLLAIFLVEATWYALVALVLSSARPRQAYLSCKTWVDRTAGAVMLGLGIKLAASATQP